MVIRVRPTSSRAVLADGFRFPPHCPCLLFFSSLPRFVVDVGLGLVSSPDRHLPSALFNRGFPICPFDSFSTLFLLSLIGDGRML